MALRLPRRVAFSIALCLCAASAHAAETVTSGRVGCAASLDRAVTLAADGDTARAERALLALATRCATLRSEIAHNLGVLAVRAGRPRAAIALFERALAAEPRVAETFAALRALHRREAAIAYARALGGAAEGGVSPALPALRLHGADERSRGRALPAPGEPPRDLATLEYELYDWWRSAGDPVAWLEHYADGYPEALALADRERGGTTPWSAVRCEIALTERDAVAVLEHAGTDGATARRLLLLRLEGSRWKIYAERPL